jgi:hypothetical protein
VSLLTSPSHALDVTDLMIVPVLVHGRVNRS